MSPIFPFIVLVPQFLVIFILLLVPSIKARISKDKYYPALCVVLFLLIGAVFIATMGSRDLVNMRDYSFNGTIEKAYYEKPKNLPHITIKGVEYDVGGLYYGNNDTIVAGDSAVKEKGSFEFKLYKKKTVK